MYTFDRKVHRRNYTGHCQQIPDSVRYIISLKTDRFIGNQLKSTKEVIIHNLMEFINKLLIDVNGRSYARRVIK